MRGGGKAVLVCGVDHTHLRPEFTRKRTRKQVYHTQRRECWQGRRHFEFRRRRRRCGRAGKGQHTGILVRAKRHCLEGGGQPTVRVRQWRPQAAGERAQSGRLVAPENSTIIAVSAQFKWQLGPRI